MQQINDSSSIEEVLYYIVSTYGKEIYKDKQRLSNLISDLYTGEERLKRVYRRAIIEDALTQQLYDLSLKPIEKRETFYNQIVSQFVKANFYKETFGKKVVEIFMDGIWITIKTISTKITKEDGLWTDEFGVIYSADKKKLIKCSDRLKNYNIKNGTIVICDKAFRNCSKLTNIQVPYSVIKIGDEAFSGCSNLTNIVIPNTVTDIGEKTFAYCKSLTHVEISNNITKIKNGVFMYCSNLTNISIPNNVVDIGDSAFEKCKSLTSIRIPDSVTIIGENAFEGCFKLINIKIPISLKDIGLYAFPENAHFIYPKNKYGFVSYKIYRLIQKCTNNSYGDFFNKIINIDANSSKNGTMIIAEIIFASAVFLFLFNNLFVEFILTLFLIWIISYLFKCISILRYVFVILKMTLIMFWCIWDLFIILGYLIVYILFPIFIIYILFFK